MPENRSKTGPKTPKRTAPKIPAPGRDTHGRFLKGATGNPGGRPIENSELKELARAQGPAAITRLTQLMHSDDPQVCIAASKALLDRGFGRCEQSIAVEATVAKEIMAPAWEDMSQEESSRVYKEMLQIGARLTQAPPKHPPEYYEAQRAHEFIIKGKVSRDPPPASPALEPQPQPKPRAEPREAVQAPTSAEGRTGGQDYIPAGAPAPASKAEKKRELWERLGQPATEEEGIAALDKILRAQRSPFIVT